MPDLLADGCAWLVGQRKDHMSRTVTYKRGAFTVDLSATIGQTVFEYPDEYGVIQRVEARDFLIDTADLILDSALVTPEQDDLILDTQGAVVTTYRVMALGTEPPWRYSDPHRKALRVHTKLTDTT